MFKMLSRLTTYLGGRVHHVFEGFTKDLSESRVILNWIYCMAYLALIFYCAQDNKSSQTTAIVTTGGIVSTIFTVYILGSSYEKVHKMKIDHVRSQAAAATADEAGQEEAAGD